MGNIRAKSQKLKQKRYLEKLKSDPEKIKEYREKAVERMRKRRSELMALPENHKLLTEMREKERERLKLYRQRKKNAIKQQQKQEPSTCKQTFRKNKNFKTTNIPALPGNNVKPAKHTTGNNSEGDLELEIKEEIDEDIYILGW